MPDRPALRTTVRRSAKVIATLLACARWIPAPTPIPQNRRDCGEQQRQPKRDPEIPRGKRGLPNSSHGKPCPRGPRRTHDTDREAVTDGSRAITETVNDFPSISWSQGHGTESDVALSGREARPAMGCAPVHGIEDEITSDPKGRGQHADDQRNGRESCEEAAPHAGQFTPVEAFWKIP